MEARLREDVNALCSPEFKGRDVPGEGGDLTAIWLAEQFMRIGLHPGVGDSSYLQTVPLVSAYLDTSATSLTLTGAGTQWDLTWGRDFYYFPQKPVNAALELQLGFYGYGIEAPELGHSDYATVATDDAAVVLDGTGDLDDRLAARWRVSAFKASAAKRAGLKALIILCEDDVKNGWMPDEVRRKRGDAFRKVIGLEGSLLEFPVLWLNKRALSAAVKLDLDSSALAQGALGQLSMVLNVRFRELKLERAFNVVGKKYGNTNEWILLGAHYDHEGLLEDASAGYYPGADDNASGVAGMLEVARRWMKLTTQARGLCLVGFTAEEDGLLGSTYFASNPALQREDIIAMINLDMIGGAGYASMREARLAASPPDSAYAAVYFSGASPRLMNILRGAGEGGTLSLTFLPVNEMFFSDAGAFNAVGIPALHLFSGFNPNYTSVSDTPDKISYWKLARMAEFTLRLTVNLAQEPGHIGYDPTIRVDTPRMNY